MAGIIFFNTAKLNTLRDFYVKKIGADVWEDQGDCIIFEKNDFKFAFCERGGEAETCGVLCFVYKDREKVDRVYEELNEISTSEPQSRTPDYEIYQFYGEDPEGRTLEFQTFL